MDLTVLGLNIVYNFITEEEEQNLINHVKTGDKKKSHAGRNTIRRYGSTVPYNSNMMSDRIPLFIQTYFDRMLEMNLSKNRPDSITINEYRKGQGIVAHIDSVGSGPVISVLGLASDAIMDFSLDNQIESINFPRRALVQMSDDIRWKWKHGVQPVPQDRYSIVFRYSGDST